MAVTLRSLYFWIFIVPLVEAIPREMTAGDAVQYLQGGGLLAYDLNTTRCSVNLPKQLPVYSWGDRVDDVIIKESGPGNFGIEFSITRAVSGSQYNLTDRAVRFTQVSLLNSQVFVEITDVDEDVSQFLQTGSITCDYQNKGLTLYGRSSAGDEMKTYDDLVKGLSQGFDLTYAVSLDMCTPNNSTGAWWSGRIAGYRFGHRGGVAFTQMVDSAQKQFFLEVKVDKSSSVKVMTFTVDRLQRRQSSTVTRTCKLGAGYRVFVSNNA